MRVDELLKQIRQWHPESAAVVDAFEPLVRVQTALQEEWAARPIRALPPYTPDSLPVDPAEAVSVAERVADALEQGFGGGDFAAAARALSRRPTPVRTLCRAVLAGDDAPLTHFAERHGLTNQDALRMVLLQTARALAAKASLRVRRTNAPDKNSGQDGRCPCCHSPADMSMLVDKEGKRLLHCSLCGHVWRYARTACPYCGVDKADNIEMVYAEGRPEERAERCRSCDAYLLAVDTRSRDIPAHLAYYVTLGMGHLDVLLQEAGAHPGV